MTVSSATHPVTNPTATRFYICAKAFSFHRQYSKIYAARLNAVKPRLINAVNTIWKATVSGEAFSSGPPIRSLNNLVTNERCVIIGIVYKEMKKKPSVLRELAASETMHSATKNPTNRSSDLSFKLFSADDSVYLEDDMQRILLSFDANDSKLPLTPTNLITGVPVALLGFEPESQPGSFCVEDVMFVEPQPSRPIIQRPFSASAAGAVDPSQCVQFRSSGPWLALVSGLEFVGTGAHEKSGHAMALQLLADWLRCAGDWTATTVPAQGLGIVRLMILGDSIYTSSSGVPHGSLTQQARYLTRNTEADSVTAMARLDSWLSTLPLGPGVNEEDTTTNGFPVDLLPGPADPTSPLLPQQPVHAAAFPITTGRYLKPSSDQQPGWSPLCGRTNPFMCQLFGRTVLATSGQGVNDLLQYTDIDDPCDRMEATLIWGHLAPSCPDTLPGYPLSGTDLLLLSTAQQPRGTSTTDEYPDIYVAGCQSGHEPSWRRAALRWRDRQSTDGGALLVSVPRFSVSRSFVLVHLETLECRVVRFDSSALDNLDE